MTPEIEKQLDDMSADQKIALASVSIILDSEGLTPGQRTDIVMGALVAYAWARNASLMDVLKTAPDLKHGLNYASAQSKRKAIEELKKLMLLAEMLPEDDAPPSWVPVMREMLDVVDETIESMEPAQHPDEGQYLIKLRSISTRAHALVSDFKK